jgi:2-octaprenyl-6-methoxyphenol hydroxylase
VRAQGLNLGLRDAATLAEIVADARRRGLDIGSPAVLARYEMKAGFKPLALSICARPSAILFISW